MAEAGSSFSHNFPFSTRDSDDVTAMVAAHNDLLPEEIQHKAQTRLIDAQKAFDTLEDEIARVQSLLDSLHHRRHKEVARIDLYHSASAPQRKLPNELLSYIFMWCTTDGVEIPWDLDEPPWTLGRVCSKWRRVALATPRLWNSITVSYLDESDVESWVDVDTSDEAELSIDSPYLAMKQEVLKRSGEAPIELIIRGTKTSHLSNPFSAFYADLYRLKDLCIERNSHAAQNFLSLSAGSIPSLETLDITLNIHSAFEETFVFHDAPNLQQITNRSFQVPLSWFSCLPLYQLTHLNVPYAPISPSTVLEIITQCPFLVTFTIALAESNPAPSDDPRNQTPAPTSTLEFFRVNLLGIEDVDITCLQSLVLPHLRTFELCSAIPMAWDTRWAPAITSSGNLDTLILRDTQIATADLAALLDATPALTVLDIISGDMIAPALLTAMACGELVPCLMKLKCLIEPVDPGLDLHLDMLEQRKRAETPAAHITDITFGAVSDDQCSAIYQSARWKEFVKEGWEFGVAVR